MNPVRFDLPIYMDPIAVFEAATSMTKIDVVDEMISQFQQGDPAWEKLVENVAVEISGDEKNEEKIEEITDLLNETDFKDLKKYISYTDTVEIDYAEQYEAGSDVSVYRVYGEFNTEQFSKDFGLDKEDDKEL